MCSPQTALQVISIMATCGLYNETGTHMVYTGLPAKSSVSGLILAVIPHLGGVVTASPCISSKGTSIRGEAILESISTSLGWHFAAEVRTAAMA